MTGAATGRVQQASNWTPPQLAPTIFKECAPRARASSMFLHDYTRIGEDVTRLAYVNTNGRVVYRICDENTHLLAGDDAQFCSVSKEIHIFARRYLFPCTFIC
jgi:hypothetical protein